MSEEELDRQCCMLSQYLVPVLNKIENYEEFETIKIQIFETIEIIEELKETFADIENYDDTTNDADNTSN